MVAVLLSAVVVPAVLSSSATGSFPPQAVRLAASIAVRVSTDTSFLNLFILLFLLLIWPDFLTIILHHVSKVMYICQFIFAINIVFRYVPDPFTDPIPRGAFDKRRLQKTEPYQSPGTAFRACTDFGSLLAKNSVGRLFCRQIPSFSVIYISFLN